MEGSELLVTLLGGVALLLWSVRMVRTGMTRDGTGCVIAALITWLAHSSLAMVLFIMALAGGGVINGKLAVALILGANLGGAIAPFAALSSSVVAARRVPLGNLIVRSCGVVLALPLVGLLALAVAKLSPEPARMAINFHMAFNLVLALGALPLLGPLAGLVTRLLPEPVSNAADRRTPRHLDPSVLETPSEALACAMRETLHMGDIVLDMLKRALPAIEGNDLKTVKDLEKADNDVDSLHEAIKLYLIRASKADMGQEDSRRYVEILTFTTNLEHVGDIIDKNLMELAIKKSATPSRPRAWRSCRSSMAASSITCGSHSTCSRRGT